MRRLNLRIALLNLLLLLACAARIEALPMAAQTDSAISHLRDLLLRDAWVHDVRLGPIAIESYILVFRKTGDLSEQISDDTGMHESAGTWQLEESDGKIVLILTGDNLRNKGRFMLKQDAKGDAIEMQLVGAETAIRFQHQKGYRSPD